MIKPDDPRLRLPTKLAMIDRVIGRVDRALLAASGYPVVVPLQSFPVAVIHQAETIYTAAGWNCAAGSDSLRFCARPDAEDQEDPELSIEWSAAPMGKRW